MADQVKIVFRLVIQEKPDTSAEYTVAFQTDRVDRNIETSPGSIILSHEFIWPPVDNPVSEIVLDKLHRIDSRVRLASSELVALGETLYQLIFPPDSKTAQALDNARQLTGKSEDSIRLVFQVESEKLSRLPWEALYTEHLMAAQPTTPFVRSLQRTYQKAFPKPILGQLNILFIGASPEGKAKLNTQKIFDELQTNLNRRMPVRPRRLNFRLGSRMVHIDQVGPKPTEENLDKALRTKNFRRQYKYHVVCFAGHGSREAIFLEDEAGNEQRLTTEKLLEKLAMRNIRLVFLLACQTAAPSDVASAVNEPDRSQQRMALAYTLAAEAKIPAIVAMQTEIGFANGQKIVLDFFQELAQQTAVDVALALARNRALRTTETLRDTIAPLMYLQTRRADLFRRQIDWVYLSLLLMVFALLVSLIVGSGLAYVHSERQQRDNQITLRLKSEEELQSVAQVAHIGRIQTGTNPQTPVLVGNNFWISNRGDNTIQSVSLTGVASRPISVGTEPLAPLFDGHSLWVSNHGDTTVTRMDIGTTPAQSQPPISVGLMPERPLLLDQMVWVQSLVDNSLTRIDPKTNSAHPFQLKGTQQSAFVGGHYLWVIGDVSNVIYRFDNRSQQPLKLSYGQQITGGLYGQNALWLVVDDQQLLQIDPDNGSVRSTLNFPNKVALADFYAGRLWVIDSNGETVYRIAPNGDQVEQHWLFGATVRHLFHSPNRLWTITDDSVLHMNDTDHDSALCANHQQNCDIHIPVPGATSLTFAISDSEYLWLTIPEQNQVLLIKEDDGSLYRTISPCAKPNTPVYDGVNVWFVCEANNSLAYVPVTTHYIPGQHTVANPSPLTINDDLWLTQEAVGQIVIYHRQYTGHEYVTADNGPYTIIEGLGGTKLFLTADNEYVWAAANDGTLTRLHPHIQAPSGDLVALPQFVVDKQTIQLPGEIDSVAVYDGKVWVLSAGFGNPLNKLNVAVLDRETLARLPNPLPVDFVPSGLTYVPTYDEVWLTAATKDQGIIYRLDAKTAAIKDHYTLPDNAYTPWRPVEINSKLWFTAAVPPLKQLTNIVMQNLQSFSSDIRLPGLYEFDPVSAKWGRIFDLLTYPDRPTVDGKILWYISNPMPVLSSLGSSNTGPATFNFNLADGSLHGPWSPCNNSGEPFIAGNFAWIGCDSDQSSMWLIDRQTFQVVHRYPSVGISPGQPLLVGHNVWFTFSGSNSAAVFDSQSGLLRRVFAVGQNPSPPFLYQDHIWTYNQADGTLQRLDFNCALSDETSNSTDCSQ